MFSMSEPVGLSVQGCVVNFLVTKESSSTINMCHSVVRILKLFQPRVERAVMTLPTVQTAHIHTLWQCGRSYVNRSSYRHPVET
jgi:hypothetical protein